MSRLNMTLDDDTLSRIDRHARQAHVPRASLARALILEALARREREEEEARWAAAYQADRGDMAELLEEMEAAQLEGVGAEDA
jgi:metal-responsive CopG/Arc/MetJ family transcriptional regulator